MKIEEGSKNYQRSLHFLPLSLSLSMFIVLFWIFFFFLVIFDAMGRIELVKLKKGKKE